MHLSTTHSIITHRGAVGNNTKRTASKSVWQNALYTIDKIQVQDVLNTTNGHGSHMPALGVVRHMLPPAYKYCKTKTKQQSHCMGALHIQYQVAPGGAQVVQ